ncbi:MAG: hypothetical protein M1836_008024 [Candelina mexicana]|nr:MAG: hypothetical protein M1836_008024 [Candelina mexicana]
MDIAYDHIQEEILSPDEAAAKEGKNQEQSNLNTEFQEAYKAISSSPWGAKLGGFLGTVRKQGESVYTGARQEISSTSEQATKGFVDLRSTIINRTRSLSLNQAPQDAEAATSAEDNDTTPTEKTSTVSGDKSRSDSEALRESEGLVARFRSEAAKRLKDIEKAEDAADEALLKFGTNIRNFLRDAVTIAPPTEEKDQDGNSKILFESKDRDGKRVIHTTRFDAQLHVIHSSLDSFTRDPESPEYEKWQKEFSVEKKTDGISKDLERFEELRRAMEKLVPEKVQYEEFWTRYYFLRHVVETEEQKRRELLKGAAKDPEEEVRWDEDSDDEPSTDAQSKTTTSAAKPSSTAADNASIASTSTINQPAAEDTAKKDPELLKPSESRKSNEHSQADSDASYDLISGATSRAPGSPKDEKKKESVAEQSDEEDWE